MATNYANIFRIDPSKNNQDFAGDSNTLAYFLTGRQDNKGNPPLITGILGNQIIVEYSDDRGVSYIDVSWNISNTGNNNLPSADISNILITGIISDGIQKKGIGQAQAIRLYDGSLNTFIDLSINNLRNEILLYIDTSNNILIKTYGNKKYNGTILWSVIFNVYDSFGIPFQAEKDISFNFSNISTNSFDNNITYDISLNSNEFFTSAIDNINIPLTDFGYSIDEFGDPSDGSKNYVIYVDSTTNVLYIKGADPNNNYAPSYIKELNFNLINNNTQNIVELSNIYLELDWLFYDVSYSNSSEIIIKLHDNYSSPSPPTNHQGIIKINDYFTYSNRYQETKPIKIGTFKTTGYSFFPDLSLNYYNINAVTDNSNFLITLDTTPQLIGQLTF